MLCEYCGTEHEDGLTAFEVRRINCEHITIICATGPAKAADARFRDLVQCEGYNLENFIKEWII